MKWLLWALPATLISLAGASAYAHNGYDGIKNAMGGDCCGDGDCRPADEGEVTESGGKVYWKGVEVPPGKLGPAPAGYDVQYHVCGPHQGRGGSLYCILRAMGF